MKGGIGTNCVNLHKTALDGQWVVVIADASNKCCEDDQRTNTAIVISDL